MGESTTSASSTGRRPRRSLDELLAMQRARQSDLNDMPTLSSFRADDLSAVTSTSYTSFASNSRGGGSRTGDCDVSLPSLSSFRMEDLSTCSSYHSIQTATNHQSDQSAEGWASFTSGNVSAETDSEDGKRPAKVSENGGTSGAPIKLSRNASGSSIKGLASHRGRVIPNVRGALKRDSSMDSDSPNSRISSNSGAEHEKETNTLPMKRPTRTVSPVPTGNDRPPRVDSDQSSPMHAITSNARPPARTSSDTHSPERTPVPRTESLQLEFLQQRPQKDSKSGSMSMSMDSLRNSSNTEGSSSSLKGGDSLPRLPRRTTLVDVPGGDVSVRSNLSDASTKISDDDVTNNSGDVSLDSDVQSDISIETDTENISLLGDNSERSTVDEHHTSASQGERRADAVSHEISNEPTHVDENIEDSPSPARRSTHPAEITTRSHGAAVTEPETATKKDNSEERMQEDTEPDTVADKDNSEERTQPDNTLNRRSAGESRTKKNDSDKSGGTSAEESGATTDTDVDDPDVASKEKKDCGEKKRGKLMRKVSSSFQSIGKSASFRNSFGMTTDTDVDDPDVASKEKKDGCEKKRGKLMRKVSSSFQRIGKSASFRNSFGVIGKQASKLNKKMGTKRQAEDDKEVSKPSPNELETQDK
jgi:hypothetical protein